MNREIKFKLWDNFKKEWHIGRDFLLDLDGEPLFNLGLGGLSRFDYNCRDQRVCQYTGLKDKNGQEIYEGDIVKVKRCHTVSVPVNAPEETVKMIYWHQTRVDLVEDGEETGLVLWFDPFFQWTVSFEHIRYDDCEALIDNSDRYEVIGNRFENPDLIKEI